MMHTTSTIPCYSAESLVAPPLRFNIRACARIAAPLVPLLFLASIPFSAVAASTALAQKYYLEIGAISSSLKPRIRPASYSLSDARSEGWKISLGYRFFKHWSIEYSQTGAGEAEINSNSPNEGQSNPIATVHYKAKALNLVRNWRPQGSRVNSFIRAGVAKIDTRVLSRAASYNLNQLHRSTLLYGLGLEWSPDANSQLRLSYDSYDKDLSWISLSLLMGLGPSAKPPQGPLLADSQSIVPALEKGNNPTLANSVESSNTPCRPFTTNVFFLSNSHELLADDKANLYLLSRHIDTNIAWSVSLQGHADYRGSSSKNEALSANRNRATLRYIKETNPSSSGWHFTLSSLGEREQFDPTFSPSGRANNRRVHLKFSCGSETNT